MRQMWDAADVEYFDDLEAEVEEMLLIEFL